MIGSLWTERKYWIDAGLKPEFWLEQDLGFSSIIFLALKVFRNNHIHDFILPDENITYQIDSLVFYKSHRWNLSTKYISSEGAQKHNFLTNSWKIITTCFQEYTRHKVLAHEIYFETFDQPVVTCVVRIEQENFSISQNKWHLI